PAGHGDRVVDLRLHLGGAGARQPGLEVEQVLRGRHADLVPLFLVTQVLLGERAGNARRVYPLACRGYVGCALADLEGDVREELAVVQLRLAARDPALGQLAARERVRERHLELEAEGVAAEVVRLEPTVRLTGGPGEGR